jgi:hypothetical protein
MTDPRKINDLELAIRTVDDMLPELSTEQLQKWKGILTGALTKIDKELVATHLHTCQICFLQEWGYRDEMPSAWFRKGGAEICFQHDYVESEKLLKEAGFEVDAFFPVEVFTPSLGSLKILSEQLPPPKTETEHTLDELMALI